MRISKRRGPFRILDVYLEDLSRDELLLLAKKTDRLSVLTHQSIQQLDGFSLRQKQTPNIYLDEGIDVVFSRFRDTVRNEIRRTQRIEGFRVELPDANITGAYEVYQKFERAQKRDPITREEFAQFKIASAYVGDRLISGITFFQSGDAIRIRSIYSLRMEMKEESEKSLYQTIGYASKRLMFEICTYGIAHGARLVDLASINLTDPEKAPIARFKSGFGAKIEDEYQYTWLSPRFRLIQRLASLKSRGISWLRGRR